MLGISRSVLQGNGAWCDNDYDKSLAKIFLDNDFDLSFPFFIYLFPYFFYRTDLSCGRPPNVRNAKAQYPSTKFGETVTYVCNEGYTLSGASQRTCRANEKWDGVGPNCCKYHVM